MQRDLVERAMAGDHDAFSEVARVTIDRLFNAARLILRDDGQAQDAVQEALVAAWRDLSALRDPDRFEAWLHRLLVRACYREARRGRRRWTIESQVAPLEGVERDPAIELANRDQLERGFRRIDVDERSLLVLRFFLELSIDEIAVTLGVPAGTVQSRLHRAKANLRAAVDADARSAVFERRLA